VGSSFTVNVSAWLAKVSVADVEIKGGLALVGDADEAQAALGVGERLRGDVAQTLEVGLEGILEATDPLDGLVEDRELLRLRLGDWVGGLDGDLRGQDFERDLHHFLLFLAVEVTVLGGVLRQLAGDHGERVLGVAVEPFGLEEFHAAAAERVDLFPDGAQRQLQGHLHCVPAGIDSGSLRIGMVFVRSVPRA
jgi:hypothetical protein